MRIVVLFKGNKDFNSIDKQASIIYPVWAYGSGDRSLFHLHDRLLDGAAKDYLEIIKKDITN
jgi:hypothetical protein